MPEILQNLRNSVSVGIILKHSLGTWPGSPCNAHLQRIILKIEDLENIIIDLGRAGPALKNHKIGDYGYHGDPHWAHSYLGRMLECR